MAKKEIEVPKIWALTRTEYAGQCTGFGSETIWLGLFLNKPDVPTIAPFIGKYLSDNMGEAIAQVHTLTTKEAITRYGYDFELTQVPVGVVLNKD